MYLVESKAGAIGCMLLSLLCLGTWPAFISLQERRGRLPQHTYLDYAVANMLAAIVIALTLGQLGSTTPDKPNFITQLSQDNLPSVLFAMAGGVFLCMGNLACQYAFAFVGLSVTEVITASLTVVLGTTINYFLDGRINRAEILFPGVACFLIAVFLASAVHASNAKDNKAKLNGVANVDSNTNRGDCASTEMSQKTKEDLEKGSATKAKAGTALYLMELEDKRAIKVFGKNVLIGLALTFFGGLSFSLFSPAFNLATNDQWHTLKPGVPHLTVYTSFFYFSLTFFLAAVAINVAFLYYPILSSPKSSFKAYLFDWNGRGWSFLAGTLCGVGNGLQFMGGQAAGYAAADAVQALPLVSTFWGVVLFGEYRRSSGKTYVLLGSMLCMFVAAVGVLMGSSGTRK